jgi:hypothetical protein
VYGQTGSGKTHTMQVCPPPSPPISTSMPFFPMLNHVHQFLYFFFWKCVSQGPDIHDQQMKGIIPRMIETIFTFVEEASETMEFLVKVSYIEIYMEKIRDLMART